MTNDIDSVNPAASTKTWQLNALTAALGDLTLTVDDSLSVGRGNDNDVVLGSKQVSRNHAVLSVLDGQLYVKDLDSSNGTFVNDRRIEGNESNLLQVDDTLGFASFAFQVHTSVANELEMPRATADESVVAIVPSTVASTESAEIFDEPVTAEETVTNEAITENVIMEDAVVEDAIVEDAVIEETIAEEAVAEEPVVEDAMTKDTVIEQPIVEEPVLTSSEPIVKETGIEDILSTTDTPDNVSSETDLETKTDASDISTAIIDVIKPVSQEAPIVKETGINTVLSAADSVEPSPIEETPVVAETVSNDVISGEPEAMATEPTVPADNEPLVEQPAVDEEPAVQMAHDKTTTTELQEEADPDVLRAKQAATSQFSGTANLGQSHDLGTQGNNAADQQISNPANAGHIEKKPSGGWFIWVFAAILIIGLALWLFNKGIV
ncbi:FHA domain-containing protein [Psychrobacter sp. SWN149]|uniref:FHA domain-containing protein n=1 Tax=Psychrobacter sp. SWN149 TaxID=2792057 RepID=UPI0018CC9C71|nr:FHA domain-containing protein [Psychrobacter sp. SWN149]MBH0005056.1 FHA domain-containing protein [Psychrobacter sp. SWN149]